MKRLWKLLQQRLTPTDADSSPDPQRVRLASAALFFEAMRADHDIGHDEMATFQEILTARFSLTPREVQELIAATTEEVEAATSLYQFTQAIVASCGAQERYDLIRDMWRIAVADERIDKYEEHLVRRVAGLLYVSERDFVRARAEARDGQPVGRSRP